MKWAPTLVVLGAFCVLLYMTKNKPPQGPGGTTASGTHAPTGGSMTGGGGSTSHAPTSNAPAANAPAATTPPAPDASTPAARARTQDEGPAVEAVKPAQPPAAPPARSPDSIVGTVKDRSDDLVSKIEVRLVGADGKEIASRKTDASGRFAFENVTPGNYTLATWDPDYLYTMKAKTSVTARRGEAVEAELRVDRGTSRVRGVVTDGSGKALADKRVTLTAGGAEFSVTTDAKGAFIVSGLAPGEWHVIADGVARQGSKVKVEEGATADVTLQLPKKASLEVTISGTLLHPAEFHGGEKALLRSKDGKTLSADLVAEAHGEGSRGHSGGAATARFAEVDPGDWEIEAVDAHGKSLIHRGSPWSEPIALTLREGESRPVALPTALAALSSGTEVPMWIKIVMIVGIGLLVCLTPVLFPPPLVPRRPAPRPTA